MKHVTQSSAVLEQQQQQQQQQQPTLYHLPVELLVVIFDAGDAWHAAGALARTCRHWLRVMTSPCVVHALLHQQQQEGFSGIRDALPRWLFYALPALLLACVAPLTWHQYVAGRRDLVYPLCVDPERYFYTGSDVARRLYAQAAPDTETQLRVCTYDPRRMTTTDCDCVFRADIAERIQCCIETFELSVMQQGFLQVSETVEPELYTTVLAIYSRCYKKLVLVIHPRERIVGRSDHWLPTDSLQACAMLHEMIDHHHHHSAMGHLESFENCPRCLTKMIGECENYAICQGSVGDVERYLVGNNYGEKMRTVVSWIKRVRACRLEFVNFEPLYVVSPLVGEKLRPLKEAYERQVAARQARCEACHGATVAYLAEGIWGPCLDCSDWYTYDVDLAASQM